ncbi:HAD family hydrolase [Celeribacter marinus]|uniref:HAD family hydrolase n=1 Tax=Celeribacter marinus TaxID=1397108 RepID=UPI003F6A9954
MTHSARPVRAVLFDKDGTLIDFQKTWGPWAAQAIRDSAAQTGVAASQIAETLRFDLTHDTFHRDSPVIAGTPDDLAELLKRYLPELSPRDILALITPKPGTLTLAPVAGLVEMHAALGAAGIAQGVVTNDFEGETRGQIRDLGLDGVFGVVIGYDSGHGGKPAPEGCLAAARALGSDPRDTVMVGDSLHDLNAGRAAGMRTVAVLTGVAVEADLSAYADVVLASIADLPAWIARQGTA